MYYIIDYYYIRGRLFPTYRLSGAVTGRMSCSSPNLHGTPRLPEFRALVAPSSPGGLLVKGDFSQVPERTFNSDFHLSN